MIDKAELAIGTQPSAEPLDPERVKRIMALLPAIATVGWPDVDIAPDPYGSDLRAAYDARRQLSNAGGEQVA